MSPCRVICLAGPTGSGKTELALELAVRFNCEIINADSRQVYRDFPITTAQPGESEQAVCPHHLYGYLESSAKTSAGKWRDLAGRLCDEITAKGKIPLVVGGTGLYFDALLNGIAAIPPVPPDIAAQLSDRIREEGPALLHAELSRLDPVYASRIHPNDRQRIQRALEVYAATGQPFSWWHANAKRVPLANGPLFVLNTSLADLKPRLAQRIELMLAKGAVEEIQAALRKCPDQSAPAWSGIGCGELVALLADKINMRECREQWLANTRAYAKRQITWFKARKSAVWIAPDEIERIAAAVRHSQAPFIYPTGASDHVA